MDEVMKNITIPEAQRPLLNISKLKHGFLYARA
jgi:hypothetical protein